MLIFRLVLMLQYDPVAYLGEYSLRFFITTMLHTKFRLTEELTKDKKI